MRDVFSLHFEQHRATVETMDALLPNVRIVADVLREAFATGHRLYTFGNGGSAADAQHFTGELIGHYRLDRRPLPAVTLSTDPTVLSCIANDYEFDAVFARQVEALARPGDVVAAFSTSGSSPNIVSALAAAQTNSATTVLFGGGTGGPARKHADHALLAPSTETPRIQEMHTLMLHALADDLDRWAAATETRR
jgi:D-sedoheptulose 7-phosphate isomerase